MSDKQTTVLDQLYLEWSQFTEARTRREVSTDNQLKELAVRLRSMSGSQVDIQFVLQEVQKLMRLVRGHE